MLSYRCTYTHECCKGTHLILPFQLAVQLDQRIPRRGRGGRDRRRRGQRGELRAEGRDGLRDAALLGQERARAAEAALRLPRHTRG